MAGNYEELIDNAVKFLLQSYQDHDNTFLQLSWMEFYTAHFAYPDKAEPLVYTSLIEFGVAETEEEFKNIIDNLALIRKSPRSKDNIPYKQLGKDLERIIEIPDKDERVALANDLKLAERLCKLHKNKK